MNRGPVDSGEPDRLYTVTGGRSHAGDSPFDLVTIVVAESEPALGMQSEHIRILRLCRNPTAVVEVAAHLGLPITVVKILLGDLREAGRISARHPRAALSGDRLPEPEMLKKVLRALQNL
ncbi:DUF742 domain-containing protein [Streptomyces sp. NBC_01190]|uniref:DUF742 domain-containing protein n=1 Tax=Streptomyces sp. NBC_01190 TaxID=2903767 RepID=UPI0038651EBC|nr:DUF742 domain-containing protein [Streptomyces sp. NBC_01190]